jgi:hypothetical protein
MCKELQKDYNLGHYIEIFSLFEFKIFEEARAVEAYYIQVYETDEPHKGYNLTIPRVERTFEIYGLVDPDGMNGQCAEFEADVFAEKYNLDAGKFKDLLHGKIKTLDGWRLITDDDI